MHKLANITNFVLLLLFVAIAFTGITYAQSAANGFKITPVLQEYTIEPGTSTSSEVKVTNPSEGPVEAKIVINDFVPSLDESGKPSIIIDSNEAAPGNSFKSLVDIDENETYTIGPKEEITIPIELSVPEGASPGGYYGTVRAEAISGDQGQVNVTASVGTLFLITVPGELNERLNLIEFTTANAGKNGTFIIGNGSDLQIVTRIQNAGNIHTKPYGKVTITDRSGNIVESYEFNDTNEGGYVLPDSIRKFVDEVNYDKFFGKYTATAYFGYGDGGNLVTATTSFWVIPLWIVIVAVVAIVAVLVGAFLIYNKMKGSRKHKVKPRR